MWVHESGLSSITYRFRILSDDLLTLHVEGSRVLVNLDPQTLRPKAFTAAQWESAAPLLVRGFVLPHLRASAAASRAPALGADIQPRRV